jgi:hypothetical protein
LKLALKRRPVSSAEELPDPKEIRGFDSPDLRSKFPVTSAFLQDPGMFNESLLHFLSAEDDN